MSPNDAVNDAVNDASIALAAVESKLAEAVGFDQLAEKQDSHLLSFLKMAHDLSEHIAHWVVPPGSPNELSFRLTDKGREAVREIEAEEADA